MTPRNADILVNGRRVRIRPRRHLPGTWQARAVACATVFLFALAVPRLAFGFGLDLDGWIKGLFDDACSNLDYAWSVSSLTAGFTNLININNSAEAYSPLYNLVDRLIGRGGVIRSLSATLLCAVILMQLVKISQRMDANAQMPALKEILQLFFFCAIWMWLVGNSKSIMSGIAQGAQAIAQAIGASQGGNSLRDAMDGIDMTFSLSNLLIGFLTFVFSIGVTVELVVLSFMRGVQMYFYTLFSPIAMTFLAFDEIRQWGVGFFKGYISVALSSAVMAFIVASWPIVTSTIANTGGDDPGFRVIMMIAMLGAYCGTLAKSGSMARDILGG